MVIYVTRKELNILMRLGLHETIQFILGSTSYSVKDYGYGLFALKRSENED